MGGLCKEDPNKSNPDTTKGTQRERTSNGPVYVEYPGSPKLYRPKVTQQSPRTKERRDGSGCLMSTVFSLGGVKKVLEGVSRWLWNALQMPNVSEMYTLKYLKW